MATIDLYENSDRRPADVLGDLDLSDDALELMTDAANTRGFLQRLADAELYSDSFQALARALPKNFAIVWARDCLSAIDLGGRPESAVQCLQAVDAWLSAPDEAARRRAADLADAANYAHPEAWLAAAIGWSSGSLAPEGLETVRPADHLTAVAAAACLSLLASAEPEEAAVRSSEFIERGLSMVAPPDSVRGA
jgi:hypothetical protein